MTDKLYIVNLIGCDGYDVYEVSYHRTRKGALRYIMARKYQMWELLRHIQPGGYDDECMYVTERELFE